MADGERQAAVHGAVLGLERAACGLAWAKQVESRDRPEGLVVDVYGPDGNGDGNVRAVVVGSTVRRLDDDCGGRRGWGRAGQGGGSQDGERCGAHFEM